LSPAAPPASPRGAALVTGGAKRIGRALSLALAGAGFDLAIHAHSDAVSAERTADEARALGRRATVVIADLADEEAVSGMISRAAEALGPVTLLVNNASLFLDDRVGDDRVGGLEREGWDRQFAVNLRAPVLLAQAFAAQSFGAQGGFGADADPAILNLLDQRVLRPNPQFFTYTLTKAALWTATRTLAQALAPRIRVNGVGPGPTLASVHQDPATFAAEAAGTLLERVVDTADLCAAALYLVDARTVTGQMLAVDSGQHLGWRTPDIVSP